MIPYDCSDTPRNALIPMMQFVIVVVLLWVCGCSAQWQPVQQVVEEAIKNHAFPGAVALVADRRGIIFQQPFGHFTYGEVPPFNHDNPPMTLNVTTFHKACSL